MSLISLERPLGAETALWALWRDIEFEAQVPSKLHAHSTLAEVRRMLTDAGRIMLAQEERIRHLESLSLTDDLTGLMNPRAFMRALTREVVAAKRSKQGQGVLAMVALDGLKPINDLWGEAAGDAYVQAASDVLQNLVRFGDDVARIDGQVFGILLPRLNAKIGLARVEQIAKNFNVRSMHWKDAALPLRASFAAVSYGEGDTAEAVLAAADLKLRAQKNQRTARVQAGAGLALSEVLR